MSPAAVAAQRRLNFGGEIFKGIIVSLGTVVSGTSLLFITKAAMPPMSKMMPPMTLDLTAQNAERLAQAWARARATARVRVGVTS